MKNLICISGGKDSTALLILATLERGLDVLPVFADTGHEHPETYKYLDFLETRFGTIRRVRADFAKRIAGKRAYIKKHWVEDGVTQDKIEKALAVLYPTGNTFLDLCLWKGRFPSTRRRFCSQHLKHEPIRDQIVEPLLADGHTVISWQGVRADESRSRRNLPIVEEPENGLISYRPLIHYTAQDVFDLHRKHNIPWNPLYEQGMGRVGCMPCIHATKGEIREISLRWPEVIEWLADMERRVSFASKQEVSVFFDVRNIEKNKTANVSYLTHGVNKTVNWSKTTRGGKQYDIQVYTQDLEMCSSIYGLCESAE